MVKGLYLKKQNFDGKKSSGRLKFTISVKLIQLQTYVHFTAFQGYSKVKLEGYCEKTDQHQIFFKISGSAGQAY